MFLVFIYLERTDIASLQKETDALSSGAYSVHAKDPQSLK
jgi:hypothetical protein